MEEYSKSQKLIPFGQTPMEDNIDDEIKLYIPKNRGRGKKRFLFCFRIFRFIAMVFAFFFIYYCLYQLYLKNAKFNEDVPSSETVAEASNEETEPMQEVRMPLLIDESESNIDLKEYIENAGDFKFPEGEGVKVFVVNSHSSEKASQNLTVSDLAADLVKILESRGIRAYFDDTANDENGTIGAYSKMRDNVARLKDIHNEAFVVIDIHNSDSGLPYTFSVGILDSFAWQENLRFACGIYKIMKDTEAAFRILPSSLGQDSGLITLNLGIGGDTYDDSEARILLSLFADAFLELIANEPLA
jgi:hypothetical protein